MRSCRYLLLLMFSLPLPAWTAIYQYIDGNGTRVYTNTPHRGAVRLDLPSVPVLHRRLAPVTVPMASRPHGRRHHPPEASRLAAQLRVSPQTQQVRDQQRRQILQSELSREERRLQDTQRRLAQAARDSQEAAQLQDRLTAHQKNIAALRQELASGH